MLKSKHIGRNRPLKISLSCEDRILKKKLRFSWPKLSSLFFHEKLDSLLFQLAEPRHSNLLQSNSQSTNADREDDITALYNIFFISLKKDVNKSQQKKHPWGGGRTSLPCKKNNSLLINFQIGGMKRKLVWMCKLFDQACFTFYINLFIYKTIFIVDICNSANRSLLFLLIYFSIFKAFKWSFWSEFSMTLDGGQLRPR